MRFSNIVETICRSETSETEDTSSDNHSMASEDDDLRARRAGNIKLIPVKRVCVIDMSNPLISNVLHPQEVTRSKVIIQWWHWKGWRQSPKGWVNQR